MLMAVVMLNSHLSPTTPQQRRLWPQHPPEQLQPVSISAIVRGVPRISGKYHIQWCTATALRIWYMWWSLVKWVWTGKYTLNTWSKLYGQIFMHTSMDTQCQTVRGQHRSVKQAMTARQKQSDPTFQAFCGGCFTPGIPYSLHGCFSCGFVWFQFQMSVLFSLLRRL